MAAKQAMKENVQCTSKYGHLRISQDICHVRTTDIEGFLAIYGHSDNLLNNNYRYFQPLAVGRPNASGMFPFLFNLRLISISSGLTNTSRVIASFNTTFSVEAYVLSGTPCISREFFLVHCSKLSWRSQRLGNFLMLFTYTCVGCSKFAFRLFELLCCL